MFYVGIIFKSTIKLLKRICFDLLSIKYYFLNNLGFHLKHRHLDNNHNTWNLHGIDNQGLE